MGEGGEVVFGGRKAPWETLTASHSPRGRCGLGFADVLSCYDAWVARFGDNPGTCDH